MFENVLYFHRHTLVALSFIFLANLDVESHLQSRPPLSPPPPPLSTLLPSFSFPPLRPTIFHPLWSSGEPEQYSFVTLAHVPHVDKCGQSCAGCKHGPEAQRVGQRRGEGEARRAAVAASPSNRSDWELWAAARQLEQSSCSNRSLSL